MTSSVGHVGVVRLGTRSSRLARWQSERVAALLRAHGAECELVPIETRGDDIPDRPLPEIGGEGLFTERIEQALRDGGIDIAVHSLKDLPVEDADELCVGAVLGREEVREVLVSRGGRRLADLPAGSVIGSSSNRRQAQLLAVRPDLVVKPIRGNVETRIRKVESGGYDATLLAAAGVCRLGLESHIAEWLPVSDFLPAPGQGAIAVQCRTGDAEVRKLLAAIEEPGLRAETDAERGFLRALGGGCSAPVGAMAVLRGGRIHLEGRVASVDGRRVVDVQGDGADAAALAAALAREALGKGARDIMSSAGRAPAAAVTGGPLDGLRVVVTRPRAQAEEVCRALREAGAIPLPVPVVSVTALEAPRGLDEAIDRLESYDWLVAASANGVRLFLDRLAAVRPGFDWSAAAPRVAAVGPGTAAALEREGIRADYVAAVHTGAAVAEELARDQGLAGRRVLLPRALEGREEAAAILRSHGAAVDDVPVYRTDAAEPTDAEISQLERGVDAVLFMSGSAVRAWCDLAGTGGGARPGTTLADRTRGAVVACIGPSTAAEARQRGMHVDVEASTHSAAGLVDALRRLFAQRRTP